MNALTHDVSPEQLSEARSFIAPLKAEIARTLVGQHALVDRMLICLLTRNHLLVEGLPGLAKTLAVRTLADCVGGRFGRVQFTPDLLPADVLGTNIYNPATQTFTAKPGPVFTNLLLADEINRAPAKVQSALLEAMQEGQVTLGGESRPLPNPFLVMATQNPIEQEGTYPLPEAQLDRFMMKVLVSHPSLDEERQILRQVSTQIDAPSVNAVTSLDAVTRIAPLLSAIHLDERLEGYLLDLVFATRDQSDSLRDEDRAFLQRMIQVGASPRATLALAQAARTRAFMEARDHVLPEDLKALAPDILRHRLILTYEADAEQLDADAVISRLLNAVPTP